MNPKYKLTKNRKEPYKLEIGGNNDEYKEIIYNTILLFVDGFKADNNLFLNVEHVESLESLLKKHNYILPDKLTINLIDNISKQIYNYEKNGVSLYGLDLDDILVINYNTFLIVSIDYFINVEKNNERCLYFLTNKPYFSSPELYNINKFPMSITIKSLYYSIGVLVTFCLTNKYLLVGNEIKSRKEIIKVLEPLKGRKLYWFILRCLEDEQNNRHLLLI
jgi:hypothetical protein